MAGVVLDTSVWIQIERNQTLNGLITEADELILAAAALGELRVPESSPLRSESAREASRKVVDGFVQAATFAPIDEKTSQIFAELKAFTQSQGRPTGVNDLWIAAAAIRHKAELITLDRAAAFQDLPGLTVRS
jgi:predicted nucleic acid-binding protein